MPDTIHGSFAFVIYGDNGIAIAEAAKAYFDAIRIHLPSSGKPGVSVADDFSGLLSEDGSTFFYDYGTTDQ